MEIPSKIVILVLVVIILTLVPNVLGPILIRMTLRQSARPEVDTFPPDDPDLPKKVAAFFRKVTAALKPLGFEVVSGLTLPNQTPRVKAIVLMYANRGAKVAAIASAVFAEEQGAAQLKTAYVEFVTRYRDGSAVQTNNSSELGAFAPRDNVTTARVPMVADPARVYRVHQAMEERAGSRTKKVMRLDEEFKGDAAAYLAQSMVEELEGQLGTGYLYLADEEEAFRPTWKGALLMTWSQLPPFKNIGKAKRDREARKLLAELDEPA